MVREPSCQRKGLRIGAFSSGWFRKVRAESILDPLFVATFAGISQSLFLYRRPGFVRNTPKDGKLKQPTDRSAFEQSRNRLVANRYIYILETFATNQIEIVNKEEKKRRAIVLQRKIKRCRETGAAKLETSLSDCILLFFFVAERERRLAWPPEKPGGPVAESNEVAGKAGLACP